MWENSNKTKKLNKRIKMKTSQRILQLKKRRTSYALSLAKEDLKQEDRLKLLSEMMVIESSLT